MASSLDNMVERAGVPSVGGEPSSTQPQSKFNWKKVMLVALAILAVAAFAGGGYAIAFFVVKASFKASVISAAVSGAVAAMAALAIALCCSRKSTPKPIAGAQPPVNESAGQSSANEAHPAPKAVPTTPAPADVNTSLTLSPDSALSPITVPVSPAPVTQEKPTEVVSDKKPVDAPAPQATLPGQADPAKAASANAGPQAIPSQPEPVATNTYKEVLEKSVRAQMQAKNTKKPPKEKDVQKEIENVTKTLVKEVKAMKGYADMQSVLKTDKEDLISEVEAYVEPTVISKMKVGALIEKLKKARSGLKEPTGFGNDKKPYTARTTTLDSVVGILEKHFQATKGFGKVTTFAREAADPTKLVTVKNTVINDKGEEVPVDANNRFGADIQAEKEKQAKAV